MSAPTHSPSAIDPRGPRFAAAITSVVLAGALVLGPAAGWPLLALQAVAFAAGALLGVGRQPYGWLFRTFVRPRLAAPAHLEDARPPRFAQTVGLAFALVGLLGVALAVPALFYTALGMALVAALLNAAFDVCLGCELYLLGHRLLGRTLATART